MQALLQLSLFRQAQQQAMQIQAQAHQQAGPPALTRARQPWETAQRAALAAVN